MRRTIPILALALLGSAAGCTTRHCDFGTLTIYWTFTDAAGVTRGCTGSGVDTVRVTIDDGAPDDWACQPFGDGVEGITYTNFTSGTHSVQVEGLDASMQQLYLYQADVPTNGCADTVITAGLAQVVGDLNVTYSIAGNVVCETPTAASPYHTTFIWYRIRDLNGQVVSAADATASSTAVPCSDTNRAFVVPGLAFGTYTIDGIEEVQLNADRTFDVVSYACTPSAAFQHSAQGDSVAAPPMVVGSVNCF